MRYFLGFLGFLVCFSAMGATPITPNGTVTPLYNKTNLTLTPNGMSVILNTNYSTNLDGGVLASNGSTTRRKLSDRFAEIVDVKDYGAAIDGVTDDTAAVQAAWDTGRTVTHGFGVMKISAPLRLMHSNQKLIFNNNVILCTTPGQDGIINGSALFLGNVQLITPNIATPDNVKGGKALGLTNLINSSFKDIIVQRGDNTITNLNTGFTNGVNASTFYLNNVTFSSVSTATYGFGIYANDANSSSFENGSILAPLGVGSYVTNSNNVLIEKIGFEGTSTNGIIISDAGVFQNFTGNLVKANRFELDSTNAIPITLGTNSLGNTVQDNSFDSGDPASTLNIRNLAPLFNNTILEAQDPKANQLKLAALLISTNDTAGAFVNEGIRFFLVSPDTSGDGHSITWKYTGVTYGLLKMLTEGSGGRFILQTASNSLPYTRFTVDASGNFHLGTNETTLSTNRFVVDTGASPIYTLGSDGSILSVAPQVAFPNNTSFGIGAGSFPDALTVNSGRLLLRNGNSLNWRSSGDITASYVIGDAIDAQSGTLQGWANLSGTPSMGWRLDSNRFKILNLNSNGIVTTDAQGYLTNSTLTAANILTYQTNIDNRITWTGLVGSGGVSVATNAGTGTLVASLNRTNTTTICISDTVSTITTGNGKQYWDLPNNVTFKDVKISLGTAASSGNTTVNVRLAGVTIFSTKPTIASGSTQTTTPCVFSTTTGNALQRLLFDIDAAGTGAINLQVTLYTQDR